MELKILTSISNSPASCRSDYIIGTHGGIFHSDDVVAAAILCILNRGKHIIIVRTRDSETLNQCSICIDVGGGKFDHHQPGFNTQRQSGIMYASAGLVWKEFGQQIISEAILKLGLTKEISESCSTIADRIDEEIMKFVDAEDNGVNLGPHPMGFITSFLPTWFDPAPDFEAAFESVLKITIAVLEKKIQEAIVEVYSTGKHSSIFKPADIVATAILSVLNHRERTIVIRTRDSGTSNQYDMMYASASHVWKDFGQQIISEAILKLGLDKELSESCSIIADRINEEIMMFVDSEDNGIAMGPHPMSFITSFLPRWFESALDYEAAFDGVLDITITVLENKIQETIAKVYAYETIMSRIKQSEYFSDFILEIPSQTMPWLETICDYNANTSDYSVNFVIFPYPTGGWAAQCVPPSVKEKFNQRISFPKNWAGQTDNLAKLSGIRGANFCHNGCFFVRATSKTDVIQMCLIAMKHG